VTQIVAARPVVRRRKHQPVQLGRAIGVGAMVICALGTALPLIFLFLNGVRSDSDILSHPLGLPTKLHFNNLVDAWHGGGIGQPMGRAFFNSVIVTVIAVLLCTTLAALAGYALGTFTFRGAGAVTQVILIMVAIPTQALIIPVFKLLGAWTLTNNYLGLVAVYTAFWMPFSVLLLRAAFRAFPRELLEAGRLDGLNDLGLLIRVVLPIVKSSIQGVAVINTIGIWSELLYSFLIMNKPETRTLPAAVVSFQGTYSSNFPLLYASLIISIVPMLIFYALLSSKIRKGVSNGSLK
jgi:raffinose/stachyose/melibiose transport system permease protein